MKKLLKNAQWKWEVMEKRPSVTKIGLYLYIEDKEKILVSYYCDYGKTIRLHDMMEKIIGEKKYKTHEAARAAIIDFYIEIFYNFHETFNQ